MSDLINVGAIRFTGDEIELRSSTSAGYDFGIWNETSGKYRFFIDETGRACIGNNSPYAMLNVTDDNISTTKPIATYLGYSPTGNGIEVIAGTDSAQYHMLNKTSTGAVSSAIYADGSAKFNSSVTVGQIVIPAQTGETLADGMVLLLESAATGVSVWSDPSDLPLRIDEKYVDHDILKNYVAAHHVDHSAVSITVGVGLTGGGTLESTRSISMDWTSIPSRVITESDTMLVSTIAGYAKVPVTDIEKLLDHAELNNVGTGTHDQIDTHMGESTIHFTQDDIRIPTSHINNFSTELYNNLKAQVVAGTGLTAVEDDINKTLTINQDTVVLSTDDLTEGTTNLFYTDARARGAVSATGSLSYSPTTGVFSYTQSLTAFDTDDLTEGTANKYYTDTRARASVSASGNLSYNNTTGIFGYTMPDLSDGFSTEYVNDVITVSDAVYGSAGVVGGYPAANIHSGAIDIESCVVNLYQNETRSGKLHQYTVPTLYSANVPDGVTSYIYISHWNDSASFHITTNESSINESDVVPVYSLYREGAVIYKIDWDSLGEGLPNKLHQRVVFTDQMKRTSGLDIEIDGGNNAVRITAGNMYNGINNIDLLYTDSSVVSHVSNLYYKNAVAVWVYTPFTTFNNTQYNPLSGDLTTMDADKYNVAWIYRQIDKDIHSCSMILSNDQYDSIIQAQLVKEPTDKPDIHHSHSILVGRIICKKDTIAPEVEDAFQTYFAAASVPNHSDIGEILGTGQYHISELEHDRIGEWDLAHDKNITGAAMATGTITLTHRDATTTTVDTNTYNDTRYTPIAREGVAEGVATLDVDTLIPEAQIPDRAKVMVHEVADIAARDLLVVTTGDVAVVASNLDGDKESFVFNGATWSSVSNATSYETDKPTIVTYNKLDSDTISLDGNDNVFSARAYDGFIDTAYITSDIGYECRSGATTATISFDSDLYLFDNVTEDGYTYNVPDAVFTHVPSIPVGDHVYARYCYGDPTAATWAVIPNADKFAVLGKLLTAANKFDFMLVKYVNPPAATALDMTKFHIYPTWKNSKRGVGDIVAAKIYVLNNTGSTIPAGRAVLFDYETKYITGYADATMPAGGGSFGITEDTMLADAHGNIVTHGALSGSGVAPVTGSSNLVYLGIAGELVASIQDRSHYPVIVGRSTATDRMSVTISASAFTAYNMHQLGWNSTADTTVTWNDSLREVTIAPTGSEFTFYQEGHKYTKILSDSIILDPIEGVHSVYYNNGTLETISSPTVSQLRGIKSSKVGIVNLYYSVTQSTFIFNNDERQLSSMDSGSRAAFMDFFGCDVIEGIAPTNYIMDGDGSLDSHAQIGNTAGVIRNQSLVTGVSPVSSTIGYKVFYREDTDRWEVTSNLGFPIITVGTGRMAYNRNIGGNWSMEELGDQTYALMHMLATNGFNSQTAFIMGQGEYATYADAQTGIINEKNSIVNGQLPFDETAFIATFIYQTNDTYTNTVKSRALAISTEDDFADWRFVTGSSGGSTLTGGGASDFLSLTDTPTTYLGNNNKLLYINPSATGIEFRTSITSNIAEGTNLYYTDVRSRTAVSGTGDIAYNSSTGEFSYTGPTVISAFTNDTGYITASYTGFVRTTGDETIAGVKTISDNLNWAKPAINQIKTLATLGTSSIFDVGVAANGNVSYNIAGGAFDFNTGILGNGVITIGQDAGKGSSTSTGSYGGIFIGFKAGIDRVNSRGEIFIGSNAGAGTTGNQNYSIGIGVACLSNADANNTTAIGYQSGYGADGNYCVYMGSGSGQYNNGHHSIGIGYNALQSSEVDGAVAIGYQACKTSNNNTNSVSIGYLANYSVNTIVNSIAIGANSLNTADNQCIIGDANLTTFTTAASINSNTGYQLNGAIVPLSHFDNDLVGSTAGDIPEIGTTLANNQAVYTDATGKLVSKDVEIITIFVDSEATLLAAIDAKIPYILFSTNITITADIEKDFTGIDIDMRGFYLGAFGKRFIHSSSVSSNNFTLRNGKVRDSSSTDNNIFLRITATKWTTINLYNVQLENYSGNSDSNILPNIENTTSSSALYINIRGFRTTSSDVTNKPIFVIHNSSTITILGVTLSKNDAHTDYIQSSVYKVALTGNNPTGRNYFVHDDTWQFQDSVVGAMTGINEFNFGGIPAKKVFDFTASTTWVVNHNRRSYPNALILDSLGNKMLSDINYADENTFTVSHTDNQTGKVIIQ